jgi:hypothetical protein
LAHQGQIKCSQPFDIQSIKQLRTREDKTYITNTNNNGNNNTLAGSLFQKTNEQIVPDL